MIVTVNAIEYACLGARAVAASRGRDEFHTRPSRMLNPERARHAEMHDQRLAGRQSAEQILAAPFQGEHALADETRRETVWKRLPQVGSAEHDARESRAGHRWRQP